MTLGGRGGGGGRGGFQQRDFGPPDTVLGSSPLCSSRANETQRLDPSNTPSSQRCFALL